LSKSLRSYVFQVVAIRCSLVWEVLFAGSRAQAAGRKSIG